MSDSHIPKEFHFMFFVKEYEGMKPYSFMFVHYLCLKSCAHYHPDIPLLLWADGEIKSEHYDRAKREIPQLREIRSQFPDDHAGKPFPTLAVRSDYTRALILYQKGGLYCDIDTFFCGSIADWFDFDGVTVNEEAPGSPMANTIAAPKEHPFILEWIRQGHIATDGDWGVYAGPTVKRLLEVFPASSRTHQLDTFTPPVWRNDGFYEFMEREAVGGEDAKVVSLCAHNMAGWLERIDEEYIRNIDSTFTRLAQPLLGIRAGGLGNKLTALIPFRVASYARMENLLLVTKYIIDVLGVPNVIVIEHDTSPKLMGLLDRRVRYVFVQKEDDEEPFCYAHLINTALPWVNTELVAKWDGDVVLTKQHLDEILSDFSDNTSGYVCCDKMVCLKKGVMIDEIRNGQPLRQIEQSEVDSVAMHPAAGMFIVRTAALRHIRGFSELYRGYGRDDDDVYIRLKKLLPNMAIKKAQRTYFSFMA